jgi:hypothetical protein
MQGPRKQSSRCMLTQSSVDERLGISQKDTELKLSKPTQLHNTGTDQTMDFVVADCAQSSMQAESKLHDEVKQVYKAVKLLCAQYHVGHAEMRVWMEGIHAFDQYGHGFISTEQVSVLD